VQKERLRAPNLSDEVEGGLIREADKFLMEVLVKEGGSGKAGSNRKQ